MLPTGRFLEVRDDSESNHRGINVTDCNATIEFAWLIIDKPILMKRLRAAKFLLILTQGASTSFSTASDFSVILIP